MAAPVTQLPVPTADVVCFLTYENFLFVFFLLWIFNMDLVEFFLWLQVGNAFAHQYYHILQQSPDLVHRFYQDGSKFGRPGEDGVMSTTTTMNVSSSLFYTHPCKVV